MNPSRDGIHAGKERDFKLNTTGGKKRRVNTFKRGDFLLSVGKAEDHVLPLSLLFGKGGR